MAKGRRPTQGICNTECSTCVHDAWSNTCHIRYANVLFLPNEVHLSERPRSVSSFTERSPLFSFCDKNAKMRKCSEQTRRQSSTRDILLVYNPLILKRSRVRPIFFGQNVDLTSWLHRKCNDKMPASCPLPCHFLSFWPAGGGGGGV